MGLFKFRLSPFLSRESRKTEEYSCCVCMRIGAKLCAMAKRVTVILSEDEYTQVRTAAGMVPLSAYLRGLAVGQGNVYKAESVKPKRERPKVRLDAVGIPADSTIGKATGEVQETSLEARLRNRTYGGKKW